MSVVSSKYAQLDSLLGQHDAESAWFATPPAFAWLTGGDNTVSLSGTTGVAAAGYDGSEITVVADHIEAERIRSEELFVDADVEPFDYYETDLSSVIEARATKPAISDVSSSGLETVPFPPPTFHLSETEIERYERLSVETATAVERVAKDLTPVSTERSAAAKLAQLLRKCGITPLVILVGGGERSQQYRHFTPKDCPLGAYATLTVLGRRAGLHTSVTRMVAFDPPEWLHDRHHAASRVSATAIRATQRAARSGGSERDVFAAIQDAYETVGFPGEWHAHHQGGPTGYRGREWFAHPDRERRFTLPKAFAWNPTVQGTKSEETVLVREDRASVLTLTGEWPTESVRPVSGGEPVSHPKILVQ